MRRGRACTGLVSRRESTAGAMALVLQDKAKAKEKFRKRKENKNAREIERGRGVRVRSRGESQRRRQRPAPVPPRQDLHAEIQERRHRVGIAGGEGGHLSLPVPNQPRIAAPNPASTTLSLLSKLMEGVTSLSEAGERTRTACGLRASASAVAWGGLRGDVALHSVGVSDEAEEAC